MYISSHRCKKQVGIGKTPAMDGASKQKKKKKKDRTPSMGAPHAHNAEYKKKLPQEQRKKSQDENGSVSDK
jgi:hypothetical protein